ncbi:hypothetical protein HDU93_005826 [Gonapodya sp. JEL0774]|nr:hypothetical protein HDU93_005826 [Gonapodya sp. JEL0774]
MSPFRLMFGRNPKLPFQVSHEDERRVTADEVEGPTLGTTEQSTKDHGWIDPPAEQIEAYVKDVASALERSREEALKRMRRVADRRDAIAEEEATTKALKFNFTAGQKVLVTIAPTKRKGSKLEATLTGPFSIRRLTENYAELVNDQGMNVLGGTIPIWRLRPYQTKALREDVSPQTVPAAVPRSLDSPTPHTPLNIPEPLELGGSSSSNVPIQSSSWKCAGCGRKASRLLVCTNCEGGYHLACVNLLKRPRTAWLCAICSPEITGSIDPDKPAVGFQ